jgi:Tol biopolymer transport system component
VRATVILGCVGLVFAVGCGDSAGAPERVVLTPGVGDFHDATYSPDGTSLAFTADKWDGLIAVYVANRTAAGPRR